VLGDDAERARLKKRHDEILASYQGFHRTATAYNAAMMGAGYAALFTIWNGTRHRLPDHAVLLSGALLGVSLMIYVLFELGKMAAWGSNAHEFSDLTEKAYTTADFERRWAEAQARQNRAITIANKFQPLAFWGSVITGFAAATLLAYAAFAGPLGLPTWTMNHGPHRTSSCREPCIAVAGREGVASIVPRAVPAAISSRVGNEARR
jgi:hypothetical protein